MKNTENSKAIMLFLAAIVFGLVILSFLTAA